MNIPKFQQFYTELVLKRKARGIKEYAEELIHCNAEFQQKENDPTFFFLPWDMTDKELETLARLHNRQLDLYMLRNRNDMSNQEKAEYILNT